MKKLLIANRGEIACRIARTAHRMGLATVGVYSDADGTSLHVDSVDVAVRLGSTAAGSYLNSEAVITAALDTGCDAIHPGYGFLSERAEFARAVIAAGLTWVGPKPEQIELLGNKVRAKTAAVAAGVPTSPITEVAPGRAPAGLTMPVLVKAAAGGGGRGMRIVRQHIDIAEAIEAASREALAAFGDGTVFIEPYIERGRHIEVQIIGDSFGTMIHLGERECSIQRRSQKLIEESPSPGISSEVRSSVISGALSLARHVGYEGAGTVEFLIGPDDSINFLEVNTRLQVEHPVTEAVTGLDLVELQLLVAQGKRLPVRQNEVSIRGHAIEARVVAEDPAADWLPSTGHVAAFDVPAGVRVDTGIAAGSMISVEFDSMIAKVIAHQPTRHEAAAMLERSLRGAWIAGVRTNLDCAAQILCEPDFLAGETFTGYLSEHEDVLAAQHPVRVRNALLLAATMIAEAEERSADGVTGFAPSGWRNLRTQGQRRVWFDGDDHSVEYIVGHESTSALVGAWPMPDEEGALSEDTRTSHNVKVLSLDAKSMAIEVDGVRSVVQFARVDDTIHVSTPEASASFSLDPRFIDHAIDDQGGGPTSPLPGTVIAVHVVEGDEVADGQLLMVVEAMKMEHKIAAAGAATVAAVRFHVGDRVDTGELLVELT